MQPGHRATALQNIYNEALTHTVKTITYDRFAACFPTPAAYCPESLKKVWSQMMGRFEELAKNEFEDILRERDVVRLLNELDDLVAQAWERKRKAESEGHDVGNAVGPHTLPPTVLLQAHITPYLTTHAEALTKQLHTTESANQDLSRTIVSQRQEIQRLLGRVESVVGDLTSAVDRLEQANGKSASVASDMRGGMHEGRLSQEMDEMEAELQQR
ncbi:MAG: hypothetical protein M1823_005965 [Watsoniomyces obsoletus]|nr:MAG: hypothetical protein M1823_005965 [Watsoniomyces obsoletus]